MLALIDQFWDDKVTSKRDKREYLDRCSHAGVYKQFSSRNSQYKSQSSVASLPQKRHLHLVHALNTDRESCQMPKHRELVRNKFPEVLVQKSEPTKLASTQMRKYKAEIIFLPSTTEQREMKLRKNDFTKAHSVRVSLANNKNYENPRRFLQYLVIVSMVSLMFISLYHVRHQTRGSLSVINPALGHSMVIAYNETLAQLSRSYAPDLPQAQVMEEIMRLNNLHNSYLSAGEVILMPNI